MKKHYPCNAIDICLITTGEVDLGVRSLSSFLKERGYRVALGFFDSWGLYTEGELAGITRWIGETDPKIVGISSIEFSREKAVQLMSALKKEGRYIVAGGADATLNPGYYLQYADFVVRGEGEHALAELLAAVRDGKEPGDIRNLCLRERDAQIRMNEIRPLIQDLDEIPFEDWLDISHHYMLKNGGVVRKESVSIFMGDQVSDTYPRSIYLMTNRGCSFECSFCINSEIKLLNPHEKHVRKRSVASVIDRVEHLKSEDPAISMVYIFDDDFFLRTPEEIRQFAAAWQNRIGLPFYVNSTSMTLREDKLKELTEAGLISITMGIQSGSERVNYDLYDRRISTASVIRAAQLLSRYVGTGRFKLLPPAYDIIINNPYETAADLLQTVTLCRQLAKPYYAQMHSLKLFQGTRLYRKAIRDGLIDGKDETTKYNCHDTLKHFKPLMRRGGNYYLNALLYWMNGLHTDTMLGVIPAKLTGFLTGERLVRTLNGRPGIISFINGIMPTQKRIFNLKQILRKFFAG